ncbi:MULTISPECIES: hypothetical protein [Roseomonadaceae]|uniref:HAMP domain-containing protein n=1 Tax=Falsiroseomonas oleicola TaxID=2801474 RepID=A0ABS6H8A6_9PROT|nr:hypothetical protein [Roseomonas oleicola]MBU8544942.1 hypothetical protein [Roseomonas oleicola]
MLAGLFLVLNLLPRFVILNPIGPIVRVATAAGPGRPVEENLVLAGCNETGALGRAFQRMRRSLEEAMKMLDA